MKHFRIDIKSKANRKLLEIIFNSKRVPLGFIKKIRKDKEFHRTDFVSVRDTVKPGFKLEDFDYYFNFVLNKFEKLDFKNL